MAKRRHVLEVEPEQDEISLMWGIIKRAEEKNNRMTELLETSEIQQRKNIEEAEEERNRLLKLLQESDQEKNSLKKKIKEEVECPVCLLVPRSDKIPVCRNGHITCFDCKRYFPVKFIDSI